jgi:hypothetical protein
MTTYTAVLPWVLRSYRDAFAETCRLNVYEVDNSEHNIGIMRATNLGIDQMRVNGTEWLVVMSAALRFGPAGGLDFIDHLDRMDGHRVVEAAGVFGWHLIAFHCDTIAAVGKWDPNYSPYGFDDLDLSVRYQLVYGNGGQLWDKVPVDVADAGMGHSVRQGRVVAPAEPRIVYFEKKWGRHPGAWQEPTYEHPFDNADNPVGYWPEFEGERWDT